jgi:inhibitor of KinA
VLSDSAWLVEFTRSTSVTEDEIWRRVTDAAEVISARGIVGFREAVTGFSTLTLHFDPLLLDAHVMQEEIRSALRRRSVTTGNLHRSIEIPVCYDEECAPDLERVSQVCGLSSDAVVAMHLSAEYVARLIGFVPGFCYLSGLNPALAVPRLPRPRTSVPAGSIAIALDLTGIYPSETAGGWNLIGRTPLCMFDPSREPPATVLAGDRVRFRRITATEFANWRDRS